MTNLISMLRDLDLQKNNIEQIRSVLLYVARELEKKQRNLITFINETKEYYHDGIEEELIDLIKK